MRKKRILNILSPLIIPWIIIIILTVARFEEDNSSSFKYDHIEHCIHENQCKIICSKINKTKPGGLT